ncbi:MAG: hypothetical protein MUO77_07030 [Anaerolineales bacterium]|nr:hypothetical protein [Anaerolineales bacterium]
MKKYLVTILFITALTLSACGSAASSTSSSKELPITTQLIVGAFKLESTQQEITAEQARELLPLWQVYSELLTSDTVAQEEIDGLVQQIQETMTSEQTRAIKDMGLAQSDVVAAMQEQGGNETRSQLGSNDSTGGGGNGRGDNGPPHGGGGGGPGGGDFMGGGNQRQNSSSSQNSTSSASDTQSSQSNKLLSTLLEKLIALLEKKAQQ